MSGIHVLLNCPAIDTSPKNIPPNVATSLIVVGMMRSVQPGAWSSSIGSHSNLRRIVSVAVMFSCIWAITVAAVTTVSVAVMDSGTEQA